MEQYNIKMFNKTEKIDNTQEGVLPSKVNGWTKVKNFLFQEINIEMTPKQAKVLQEVHDFWHQEVTFKSFRDFLLQDIEITL